MEAIDMHGHLVPEAILHRLERSPGVFRNVAVRRAEKGSIFSFNGREQPETMLPEMMDVDGLVAWMDEKRIDLQIEGIWSGVFGYMLPPEEGAAWSRLLNEEMVRALEGNSRFRAVATVPIQDGRLAVQELEAARKMGCVGVTIGTATPERELDDPDLEIFWEAAAGLKMPVLIHPMHLTDHRLQAYELARVLGRPIDSTIAVSRLLCAKVPLRHDGLVLILPHGGGALPYWLGRFQRICEVTPGATDPEASFRQLYFDDCVFRPEALRYLVEMVGRDRVMMGSDAPFRGAEPNPRGLVEGAGFDADTVEAILVGNTRHLFGI